MMILGVMAVSTAAFGANVKGGQFGVDYQLASGQNTLGVWWHLHDMIALAPSIGYSASDNDAGRKEQITTLGIVLPIYVAQFNKLDFFVAPLFEYTAINIDNNGNKTNTHEMSFGLGLGTQIALTEQLHLFAHQGFAYNDDDGPVDYNTFRTAVGAIFYFN